MLIFCVILFAKCLKCDIINQQHVKENDMNKLDIIKEVADETGLTQKEVSLVVDGFVSSIIRELKKGEEVNVAGFGKFVVKNRAKRTSINPRTKQPIEVPASKAPTFRAGKQFKDAINK